LPQYFYPPQDLQVIGAEGISDGRHVGVIGFFHVQSLLRGQYESLRRSGVGLSQLYSYQSEHCADLAGQKERVDRLPSYMVALNTFVFEFLHRNRTRSDPCVMVSFLSV